MPLNKENNADNVVQASDVKLEFQLDPPEVGFQSANAGVAPIAPGQNPFSTGETPRSSAADGDADLNLTEGSVQGITPRVPESQTTAQANPNTRH